MGPSIEGRVVAAIVKRARLSPQEHKTLRDIYESLPNLRIRLRARLVAGVHTWPLSKLWTHGHKAPFVRAYVQAIEDFREEEDWTGAVGVVFSYDNTTMIFHDYGYGWDQLPVSVRLRINDKPCLLEPFARFITSAINGTDDSFPSL